MLSFFKCMKKAFAIECMLWEDSVSLIMAVESRSCLRHQLACSFSIQCLCFWYRKSTASKTELLIHVLQPVLPACRVLYFTQCQSTFLFSCRISTLKSFLGCWGGSVDVNTNCVDMSWASRFESTAPALKSDVWTVCACYPSTGKWIQADRSQQFADEPA